MTQCWLRCLSSATGWMLPFCLVEGWGAPQVHCRDGPAFLHLQTVPTDGTIEPLSFCPLATWHLKILFPCPEGWSRELDFDSQRDPSMVRQA